MNTATIIVLIGITGDLSKRKLLPALDSLKEKGLLPEQFRLVGVTRKEDPALFTMDLDNPEDYVRLKEYLESIEKVWGTSAQRLFYLSVAPTISLPIIKMLGEFGLASIPQTKLLLEKPFGVDLENAKEVITEIEKYFSENQVYRIDHYLQKNTVRTLGQPNANGNVQLEQVKEMEIFAREQIGIEGRGDFYEQTGALRDFIQSHLLEVAAMMIDPANRLQVLKDLFLPEGEFTTYVKRAQYKGYRDAVQKPDSMVETFVSVTLHSHNTTFSNLAVVLKTGKALDKKSTDITLTYKDGATQVISLNDTHNAYENVFADAMNSDKKFFVSKEEVVENWRIIDPIQKKWSTQTSDLTFYEEGSVL